MEKNNIAAKMKTGSESDLSASGCLAAALETNEHDDVGLALGRVPDWHSWVQQLAQLVEH